jgi:rubrerythrin
MNILTVLGKLAKLEQDMSHTYAWLANRFAAEQRIRDLFRELSDEEKAHYDLVKYQVRVVLASPKDFSEVEVDLAAIDSALAAIAEFRRGEPTTKEAIRFALDMETSVAECYAVKVMDQSNKSLAEMIRTLSSIDGEKHRKRLVTFAKDYDKN